MFRRAVRIVFTVGAAVAVGAAGWAAAQGQWTVSVIAAIVVTTALGSVVVHGRAHRWTRYELGEQHRELAALIDAGPDGVLVTDSVDAVALIRHRGRDQPDRAPELMRISHDDLALAATPESAPTTAHSVIMVERFILGPRRVPIVVHRIEPWAVHLDHNGHLATAETPPTETPTPTQRRAQLAFMLSTGTGFATAHDVDTVIEQLRRAVSPAEET